MVFIFEEVIFRLTLKHINEDKLDIFRRCLAYNFLDKRSLAPSTWRNKDSVDTMSEIGSKTFAVLHSVCEICSFGSFAEYKRVFHIVSLLCDVSAKIQKNNH